MASNNMASNVVIWDQDTCQIPSGVEASSVSMAIQKVLRNSGFHGKIEIITSFHRSKSSADTLKAIEKSGITYEESKFVDKDAANMVLKLALYKWTKQNRIPANVFMISGDGGFLEEVNTLKHLGYQVHWSYRPDSVNDAISHSIDPKLSWYSLVRGLGFWDLVLSLSSVASS
ncbi:PREDICTED: uncharacterized protein LOC104705591 [Camelina sativa]|uniref:Uncharacterized protein LOC104705591 n=1 Tax=Camelina sativa TaxID=90675 RepID=A0ABM0T2F8_CAMSA|nr:PREDICTED: uncharacterized protein LOC104705591 [Camelina sativa]